jgi:hypothetical protein
MSRECATGLCHTAVLFLALSISVHTSATNFLDEMDLAFENALQSLEPMPDVDAEEEPLVLPSDVIDLRVMALLQSSRACCMWRHDEWDTSNNPIHISATMNDIDPKTFDGALLVLYMTAMLQCHYCGQVFFLFHSKDSLSTSIFAARMAVL